MLRGLLTQNGGRLLRQNISLERRKALARKIGKVLNEDIRMLSNEMQEILLDDLVTAFLNRLDVLTHTKNSQTKRGLTIRCSNDALQIAHGQLSQC
jgi:hypothetical protein